MKKKRSFALIELIVVLIIIGIFATLAITGYASYRERVLDKEAITALKLMQQAQKLYYMENGAYYPKGGSPSATSITAINSNLKIFLNGQNWDYKVYSKGAHAGTSTAERSDRTWTLTINATDPVCTGSCL